MAPREASGDVVSWPEGLSSRSHGNAIIERIHYQARRGVAAIEELSLDSVTTELRVERMILECRALGIEPDARTIAEIMVDDDVTVGRYEDFSDEWTVAFETYRASSRACLGVQTHVAKKGVADLGE